MSDRLLIVGLGSIGCRHARNALSLGCEVIGYDVRQPTSELLADLRSGVSLVESLEAGLMANPLGVIIATPPETHVPIAGDVICAGLPVLVEKPLTTSTQGADRLIRAAERHQVPLTVGYQFRHTPALRALKARAGAGEFGTIYTAHAEFASQQWCTGTYAADLLLECSHELDLLRWFLGEPKAAFTTIASSGAYSRSVIQFPDAQASLHLDGINPGYHRRFTLFGTKGVGEWAFDHVENDVAYIAELQDFLAVCPGEKVQPACTGLDGLWALRMVEAIRQSAESGRWEAV